MKNKVISYIDKIPFSIFLFSFVSLIFTFILSKETLWGDDTNILKMYESNFDLLSIVSINIDGYFSWSSRTLINILWFIFLKYNALWLIFFCFSVFLFFEAVFLLCIKGNKFENQLSILLVSLFCSIDFALITNAGWIASLATYLTPVSFAVMALVPIKKAFNSEKYTWYSYSFFILCMIYGGNLEQLMVVLLGSYLVASVFLILYKKLTYSFSFLSILSIANCIFCLTCPGNYARKADQIIYYFPTYDMLNILDKFDIAFSTTLKFLISDSSNCLVIIFCAILSICIFEKYKDVFYRLISVIPLTILLAFGPLKNIFTYFFHRLMVVNFNVPLNGLVNAETFGEGLLGFQWFIYGVFIISVIVTIFLLVNSFKSLIIIFTLMALGLVTRVSMGLSPSIYESGTRTFGVMLFCYIFTTLYFVANHISYMSNRSSYQSILVSKKMVIVYLLFLFWGFIDFYLLVFIQH